MPSLPTSLIIVGLVVAWLVVLVPMVAKRRERVPETDEGGAGFRVLRRASASLRRRPVLSRTAVVADAPDSAIEEDDMASDANAPDANASDAIEGDDMAPDAIAPDAIEDSDGWAAADVSDEEMRDGDEQALIPVDPDEPANAADDWAAEHPSGAADPADRPAQAPARGWAAGEPAGGYDLSDDDADPTDRGHQGSKLPNGARSRVSREVDESALRPVPQRPGRGSFDPAHAAAARAFRYSRRRRVAVVLLAATVVLALCGVFLTPTAWVGAIVAGVLLVLFLAYLRRQVRIEDEIARRRTARLARARQIRPEMYGVGGATVRPVHARGTESFASSVPPASYRPDRVVVDLEDDAPDFDDLEYYQPPVAYRRAVGE